MEDDCADLALLADMATRGLASHLWGLSAKVGQSAFEVGRSIIRNEDRHFSHYRNWQIAERDGRIAGGWSGHVMADASAAAANGPAVVRELNQLKALAAGTWYVSAAALYPEYQARGCGSALLREAEATAVAVGADRITLMVGSFNQGAHRLYARSGFQEWARRPFSPFPGSDIPGEWILMGKALA